MGKKIPTYSNANITGTFNHDSLVKVTSLGNVIKGRKRGRVIILVRLKADNPYLVQDLEEKMKNEFAEIDRKERERGNVEQDDSDMVQKKIGELCVWQNASDNLCRRARIYEMSEEGLEVKSVVCIDNGQIAEFKKEDKIRPLYSKFRSDF